MGVKIDLTGRRVGKWTVIKQGSNYSKKKTQWLCRCDCGTVREVLTDSLLYARSTNCGCERKKMLVRTKTKHRMINTPLYRAWQNMKNRCRKADNEHYKDYGGRGITYCDKWETWEGFYEDMAPTYKDGLTIERLDVNGDYCKENCVWATCEEQANNRRGNVFITVDGVTDTVSRTCKRYNVNYPTISARIRNGWEPEKAIKTPIKQCIKPKGA